MYVALLAAYLREDKQFHTDNLFQVRSIRLSCGVTKVMSVVTRHGPCYGIMCGLSMSANIQAFHPGHLLFHQTIQRAYAGMPYTTQVQLEVDD